MHDYDELVKRLRECNRAYKFVPECGEAADAITALVKERDANRSAANESYKQGLGDGRDEMRERAEKAEAEVVELRRAARTLERHHATQIAAMQAEVEGWQAERNVARQEQEAAEGRGVMLTLDEAALAYDCTNCPHQPRSSVACLIELCPPECKEKKL